MKTSDMVAYFTRNYVQIYSRPAINLCNCITGYVGNNYLLIKLNISFFFIYTEPCFTCGAFKSHYKNISFGADVVQKLFI